MVVFPHCNCVLEPELSPPLSLVPINSSHQIHPCCYDNCRLASTSCACFGSISRTGLWIYCQDSTTNLSHCQSKGRYLLSLHTCRCSWCFNMIRSEKIMILLHLTFSGNKKPCKNIASLFFLLKCTKTYCAIKILHNKRSSLTPAVSSYRYLLLLYNIGMVLYMLGLFNKAWLPQLRFKGQCHASHIPT